MYAAGRGHNWCVDMLLRKGADVNAFDVFGVTALHCASRYDHLYCMKLLIKAGADVNTKDHEGLSPLERASKYNSAQCMKLLGQHGGEEKLSQGSNVFSIS